MPEIFINNKKIEFFDNFTIERTLENVGDTFSFNTPFFPETKVYRDLFKPFSYHPVEIRINDELILTGTVEAVSPTATDSSTSVVIQGRSKTGVIVDCTFEQEDFPVQYTELTLEEIAGLVLEKYGIIAIFEADPGPLFEEAGPDSPMDTVFGFLQNLARQRSLIISQDQDGNLLFRKANVEGFPVAALVENKQGVTVSNTTYDGTRRFSSYEAFGQEQGKTDNYSRTDDPALEGIIRPKSIQTNDTNAANIVDASAWAASAAIAGSIRIPVNLTSWEKPRVGGLWKENEIVTLLAPSIMIYKAFPFLITSVILSETKSKRTASLVLTMLGAYTGELPEAYPWDD